MFGIRLIDFGTGLSKDAYSVLGVFFGQYNFVAFCWALIGQVF